jgi:hypothetical protein
MGADATVVDDGGGSDAPRGGVAGGDSCDGGGSGTEVGGVVVGAGGGSCAGAGGVAAGESAGAPVGAAGGASGSGGLGRTTDPMVEPRVSSTGCASLP